jgi:hypothetical protein
MCDQHPSLGSTGGITETVYHVIQSGFQDLEQVQPSQAAALLGSRIVASELAFGNIINAAGFLLGPQLARVVRFTAAPVLSTLSMLSWRITPAFKSTFFGKAALPFQEEFLTFTAANFTFCLTIS